ncbi:MAG: hypothetical protein AMJ65_03550 [Phycisphaerae bacterium SG8_4]|nr:MAG: hypothetical protein AMJ65_03550 [Phycisphaerae bacterium SG8_4]
MEQVSGFECTAPEIGHTKCKLRQTLWLERKCSLITRVAGSQAWLRSQFTDRGSQRETVKAKGLLNKL